MIRTVMRVSVQASISAVQMRGEFAQIRDQHKQRIHRPAEFAERGTQTLTAIAESRGLMARIGAVMAEVPAERGIP
jgi:hypothetical protein